MNLSRRTLLIGASSTAALTALPLRIAAGGGKIRRITVATTKRLQSGAVSPIRRRATYDVLDGTMLNIVSVKQSAKRERALFARRAHAEATRTHRAVFQRDPTPWETARAIAGLTQVSQDSVTSTYLSRVPPVSRATAFADGLASATLAWPTGEISTVIPRYAWTGVPGATHYYLWVNDAVAAPKISRWYESSELAMTNLGLWAVTPSVAIAPGAACWWILPWSAASGYGPWSAPLDFTVKKHRMGEVVLGEDFDHGRAMTEAEVQAVVALGMASASFAEAAAIMGVAVVALASALSEAVAIGSFAGVVAASGLAGIAVFTGAALAALSIASFVIAVKIALGGINVETTAISTSMAGGGTTTCGSCDPSGSYLGYIAELSLNLGVITIDLGVISDTSDEVDDGDSGDGDGDD